MSSGESGRCFSPIQIVVGAALLAFSLAGEAATLPAPPACLTGLSKVQFQEQLVCLRELKKAGPAVAAAGLPLLCDFLARSHSGTDHASVAAALDVLRSMGERAAPARETLSDLLSHRSKLNQERDKMLVVRLRAHIFVTLSQIGVPASAVPALLDTLAHVDERISALEVAAAARAAGTLGTRGRQFVPLLLQTFAVRLSAEEFSLERYEPQFPSQEATTVQLEVIRSLAQVCSPRDEQALAVLRDLSEDRGRGLDPRVVTEARHALAFMLHHSAKG